ncbi:phosphoadenosine phosphosulfate reductase family protein [Legionella massiliensis]|nr:phosphoadenosine phosphosulfate reductase family protein [Legionella massiliensis]
MTQHIIIGNFGNHSLAVMQALIERAVPELHFLYVDTGWAAASWPERIAACTAYAEKQGVEVHQLKAQASFSEMVVDRKQFPSPKFQWCASFLKALTILNHLDNCDPSCEALIVSGKRQQDSRRYANLQEFDYEDEYYQGRTIWYPLWQTSNDEFVGLIERAGFQLLPHQSLECSPCIHSRLEELSQIDPQAQARLEALEEQIGQAMFQYPINQLRGTKGLNKRFKEDSAPDLNQFDRGCGAPWGCGE